MLKAAIIFDNLGPYHWARLRATAGVLELLAVEVRDNCQTHGWIRQDHQAPFSHVTLLTAESGVEHTPLKLKARLHQALEQFTPQVVFLPGWSCAAAFLAQSWCLAHSVPTVVMSESNRWDEKRTAAKECVKQMLVSGYGGALVGGKLSHEYLHQLGLPADHIFSGYDAVDNNYFWEKAEKLKSEMHPQVSGLRSQPSPFPSPPFFLASARFVEKKNLPRLLQAYARYRQLAETSEIGNRKSEIWNLVLLGDGPLKTDLCHLIADLSLQDSVLLPGFKQYDELPEYYARASAFIHASTTEQWGLVVNEAMASGLPVLVSNRCGCASDLVQDGVNGFTFDPYNVEQLAQLLLKISAFNFPLSDFGLSSQRIISHWGPDRFAAGALAAAQRVQVAGRVPSGLWYRLLLHVLARVTPS